MSGRNQMPKLAEYLAGELKAAGFAADDIKIMPYEGEPGDKTVALIARWRADKPTAKPILLMAHMDVVEAKREDWKFDPFEFREEGGYFYGRGTNDNKAGMTGLAMSFLKLKQSGWKPKRDLILFFTGDEETKGNGAKLGATEWRQLTDAEYALNSDGGGGAFLADGTPLGFALQTAEKTFQSYPFHGPQQGRPFQPSAAGQCHLRAGDGVEEAGGAPLPASAERNHSRLFHASRHAGRRQRARQVDPRLAGQ